MFTRGRVEGTSVGGGFRVSGRVIGWEGGGGGVLTLQFEDWFRLGAGPSVHSAASVLQDCLLRSYSFSYVEKKSLERQRNRSGGKGDHPLSPCVRHVCTDRHRRLDQ